MSVGKVNSHLCESAEQTQSSPDINRMHKNPWRRRETEATSWKYRDELIAWDRQLRQKCSWIKTPRFLGTDALSRTHQKARGALYWPNTIKDIWGLVSRCYTGKEMLAKQQTETMKIYSVPSRFWNKPGKDLFIANHTNYLIVADKCSDRGEVDELSDEMQ